MNGISKRFIQELEDKEFRDAYTGSRVRTAIAYQIRALRNQTCRQWSQKAFGALLGKPQSVVSRLEDPDYGKLTVQTLLEAAAAFDVQLVVQFVECEEFLSRSENLSSPILEKRSFDAQRLGKWAEQEARSLTTIFQTQPLTTVPMETTQSEINSWLRIFQNSVYAAILPDPTKSLASTLYGQGSFPMSGTKCPANSAQPLVPSNFQNHNDFNTINQQPM